MSDTPADPAQPTELEPADVEIVPAETVPPTPLPVPDYDERGVPSLDHVRDKIEGRWATSVGAAELLADTAVARSIEEQEADRAAAARAKLDEIRRGLG